MSSHIPVPADLRARYSRTAEGRAWLAALPGYLEAGMERWELTLDLPAGAEPWNGHGGIVVPVLRDGVAVVLKVAFPHPEALTESHALALWNGHGAVRLLEAEQETCAMLLERLDAGRWLQDVPLDHARDAWGTVMRELSIDSGDGPVWEEFEHAAAKAERWSDELPADWEQLGRPFPRWLLEAALEVCQTRGAVGRRAGKDVLVHADLHFMNILPLPGTGDAPDAGSYRAIDPQPVIGEAEFGVAPVLWNRIGELPQSSPSWRFSSAATTSATPRGWTRKRPGNGASPGRWRTRCGTPRSPGTTATSPAPCGLPAPWPGGPWRACPPPTNCRPLVAPP